MPAADKRSQASEALPAPDTDSGRGGQETLPDRQVAGAQVYKASVCVFVCMRTCMLMLARAQ